MDADQHVAAAEGAALGGPYDVSELPDDGHHRLDLGSLLLAAPGGEQVRLAVHEGTGHVESVQVLGADGAAELRAFAAPRGGDRWATVRAGLIKDAAAHGVRLTEQTGPFGTELVQPAQPVNGQDTPTIRVIGINGPRWLLRVTLQGAPAEHPQSSDGWHRLIALIGVRRGKAPMPVGEPLPLTLPPETAASD